MNPTFKITIPKAHDEEDFVQYETSKDSSISKLLNALVVPRPIAFITSKGSNGVINAAPFSYFNIVCKTPPIVSISISPREKDQLKDTARNILVSKEFVINLCSIELAEAVSATAHDHPPEISEIELTHLSLIPSKKISIPRIANSLAQLECIVHQTVKVGKAPVDLILGEIIAIHLHQDILTEDGKVNFEKLNPLARLAGPHYAKLNDFFAVPQNL